MSTANQSRESGATLVLFTFLFATVLLPIVGLAIDGGSAFVVKARLSSAIDASALAAARSLSAGLDTAAQAQSARATAKAYFQSNFPTGLMAATTTEPVTTVTETADRIRIVHITATATAPLYFLSMFGQRNVTVGASSQASRRDVNVVLMLDRSTSMNDSGACAPMKAAAKNFVEKFANDRDKVGLVSFTTSAKVDSSLGTSFKPAIPNKINALVCGGNTGAAQAMILARNELYNEASNSLVYPGALNVIVFFTDGDPNGVYANFTPKAGSPCTASPGPGILGIISRAGTTMVGIWSASPGVAINSTTLPRVGGTTGCQYSTDEKKVKNDVNVIPETDALGNSIRGYKAIPAGPIALDSVANINAASWNSSDSAASRTRDTGILIYVIGEGSTIDANYCKRIANTPDSTSYNANRPVGRYVYAPDGGQLSSAFDTIASQILRLAQ